MIPACLRETGKLCAKHLDEECRFHFRNGATAVTVWDGQIIHVNGLQLLVERDPMEWTSACKDADGTTN